MPRPKVSSPVGRGGLFACAALRRKRDGAEFCCQQLRRASALNFCGDRGRYREGALVAPMIPELQAMLLELRDKRADPLEDDSFDGRPKLARFDIL
jgi:hypothetical protein